MWLFELVDHQSEPLAEVPAISRSLSLALNDAGSAKFSLTLGQAERLIDRLQIAEVDLQVSRGDVALFRGPVLGASAQAGLVGGTVEFSAVGIWGLFERRFTDAPFELLAIEQTTAAWKLVEVSQLRPNGALGIVAGELPASRAIDVLDWQTPTSIKSAVEGLASADDGFDFNLTPIAGGWRFDCWYPRRGRDVPRQRVVLERGRNIAPDVQVSYQDLIVNSVRAIGAGGVYVEVADETSQVRHRRREAVVTVDGSDASSALVLGDRARAALVTQVSPVPRLALVPGSPDASLDAIGLGDVVGVEAREGWMRLSGSYRVMQIDVDPDAGEPEALAVSVVPYP